MQALREPRVPVVPVPPAPLRRRLHGRPLPHAQRHDRPDDGLQHQRLDAPQQGGHGGVGRPTRAQEDAQDKVNHLCLAENEFPKTKLLPTSMQFHVVVEYYVFFQLKRETNVFY